MLNIKKDIKECKNREEVSMSLNEARILVEALIQKDPDFGKLLNDLAEEHEIESENLMDTLTLNLSELKIHNEEIDFATLSSLAKFSALSLKDEDQDYRDLISYSESEIDEDE